MFERLTDLTDFKELLPKVCEHSEYMSVLRKSAEG